MSSLLKKNLLLLVVMAMLLTVMPAWGATCAQCSADFNACSNYAAGWMSGCNTACMAFINNAYTCFNYCVPQANAMNTQCNNTYYSCYASCTP